MYNALFDLIDEDTTVITVTRRLSNYLSIKYRESKPHFSLDILPINEWFKRCFNADASNNPQKACYLLNSSHEFNLWQQIIQRSPVGQQLLQLNTTAQLAIEAWQLAKQWRLNWRAAAFEATEETAAWQAWANEFVRLSAENNWIDSHSLPEELLRLSEKKPAHCAKKIILTGFDELNPQYQWFFQELAQQGVEVIFFTPVSPAAQLQRLALKDTPAEITHMAQWCKEHLQKDLKNSIACIVPNLQEIKTDVLRIFGEILAPAANLPGYSATAPFAVSAHCTLAQYPIIHTALALLNLHTVNPFSAISGLLRSPYLGHAEQEMCARASLDVIMRKQVEPHLSTRELLMFARKHHCPLLAALINNYLNTIPAQTTQLPPGQWADLFKQQLTLLGWPGERTLNSDEYQLTERWSLLLAEFAEFDKLSNEMPISAAVRQLQQIAQRTLYQPKSSHAPIQILSPLEAAGVHFDAMWIMGLHDNAWPPITKVNPFLPALLQKQHQLPDATQEQTLNFYAKLTQQLLNCAANIVISYPQFDEERSLRPSGLINDIVGCNETSACFPPAITLAEQLLNSGQLEFYDDHQGPPLTAAEKINGGADIFKQQAACPFRAFAEHRLGAKALINPKEGLNAKERGALLHRALELLWGDLKTHNNLITMPAEQINNTIQNAINTAILELTKKRPKIFKERFTQIEQKRLEKIILCWLELEKQRPPFKVHAVEANFSLQINKLTFNVRIDRIDELAENEYIIFDYKTGAPTLESWLGDRPDEPQLPIYISANQLPVAGAAFAVIRSNKVQFKGISAQMTDIAGIQPIEKTVTQTGTAQWSDLVLQWRMVLSQLAEQFNQGNAHCDPKKNQQTCRLCHLQTLCRVNHAA